MEVINPHKSELSIEQVSTAFSEGFKQKALIPLTDLTTNISRLFPTDADLFRKAFQKEELCYSNSWLYILRSTRDNQGGFGYKFVGRETLMGIGYRNNTLYIVRPTGSGRFKTVLDLCSEIYNTLQCRVVLKKIDQELYKQLSATGLFQEYTGDPALFEEEAFPEHVLQLEKLFPKNGGIENQSLPLLKKVRRFEKSPIRLFSSSEPAIIASCSGFERLFGPNPDKYKSYRQIIEEVGSLGAKDNKYKIRAYFDESQTLHGLYISELLGKESRGLYCAVSSKSFPGITEYMDYGFFRETFSEGTHFLYLGGSETQGVDAYIKKLLPIAPSYFMRPLVMRQ